MPHLCTHLQTFLQTTFCLAINIQQINSQTHVKKQVITLNFMKIDISTRRGKGWEEGTGRFKSCYFIYLMSNYLDITFVVCFAMCIDI